MADQKRWFKVWTSLLVDMENMPAADVGHWVRLGCRIAMVGSRGSVVFESWKHAARAFHVTVPEMHNVFLRLPNVVLSDNGKLTVTMRNWTKYQEDSTQSERQRRSRSKKRREESIERGVVHTSRRTSRNLVLYDCATCGQAHETETCPTEGGVP